MIERRPFNALGGADHGWLKAKHHFSFARYHDPERMSHGALRVWNDDEIAPHTGFPPHPHADMEIITYVREGAITHEDSMGNKGRTEAGDVQVMSAGSGVRHAEYNREPSPRRCSRSGSSPARKAASRLGAQGRSRRTRVRAVSSRSRADLTVTPTLCGSGPMRAFSARRSRPARARRMSSTQTATAISFRPRAASMSTASASKREMAPPSPARACSRSKHSRIPRSSSSTRRSTEAKPPPLPSLRAGNGESAVARTTRVSRAHGAKAPNKV